MLGAQRVAPARTFELLISHCSDAVLSLACNLAPAQLQVQIQGQFLLSLSMILASRLFLAANSTSPVAHYATDANGLFPSPPS